MSIGRNRRDVKAEAHRRHPGLADPERQAKASAELDAYVAGHHLKELRKAVGKTQQELARALGVSQSRISQIENGQYRGHGTRDASRLRESPLAAMWTSPSASDRTP